MPSFLNPATWLSVVGELSRPSAAVVLVVSGSMLVFGLRAYRYYFAMAAAAAAYVGGLWLAKLMYITGWYAAAPTAAIGAIVGWLLAPRSVPVLASFVAASATGVLVAGGFAAPDYYWAGFAAGAFAGLLGGIFASRFSVVLLAAIVGSAAVVASLGPLVRAPRGPFAVGAWAEYPLAFVIVGTVLVLGSVAAQVGLAGKHVDELVMPRSLHR